MIRGFLISLCFGLCLAVWGWFAWSGSVLSSQEAVANLAKARDWFQAMGAEGGLAWWSPSFQGGTSLAPMWGTFVSWFWLWGWAEVFGSLTGPKLAMLACVPIAAGGAYIFARNLGTGELAGVVAGVFYASSPALWARIAGVEHVVVVCAMAVLPLTFLGVLRLLQAPSPLAALHAAMACSLLALTYSKAALLAAPLVVALVLWGFWKKCGVAAWLKPWILPVLFGGILLLGVLPNAPALRESSSAVLFEFGPLSGWQEAFASKSALHWFDRSGQLSAGFRPDFAATTISGAHYLGLLSLISLGFVLFFRKRLLDESWSILRISAGLGFFAFWLSHGPFSVLTGTLRALETSAAAADWTAAILWLALALQGWILVSLLPGKMPLRKPGAILLLLVYFLVPGFQLVSWMPLYAALRAPFDFYLVAGVLWVCTAGAIAFSILLKRLRAAGRCAVVILACLGVWVFDFSPLPQLAERNSLEKETVDNFEEATEFLKESGAPGGVLALSGRYFYLEIPERTGRPLAQEAFQNYLQQRPYAALQMIALASVPDFLEFLRIGGIRYVLLDLKDPDFPGEFASALRARLPAVHQSEGFEILEFTEALAPAFLVREAVLLSSDEPQNLAIGYEVAGRDIGAIGPVIAGRSVGAIQEGALKLDPDFKAQTGTPFQTTDLVRRTGLATIELTLNGEGGWVVIPEAWHKDWRAFANGKPRSISRAFGALLAVENEPAGTVVLQFSPPWWYAVSLGVSGLAWGVAMGVCGLAVWTRCRKIGNQTAGSLEESPAPPVANPLVVTPTYNEASTITALLEGVFSAREGVHVLVVDDGSPDGTADLVRAHPLFGTQLFLMERKEKLGLGSAYRSAFAWADQHGYDACVEIDADLSHNPTDIVRLLDALDAGADAAIGSRYLDGLRVVNWPEYRLLISALGTQFVRIITGLPLTDATSGFKALRMEALRKIDARCLRAEGYAFQVELHHALWKAGAHLVEVPITFTERTEGQTKMSAAIAFEAMLRVIELAISPEHPPATSDSNRTAFRNNPPKEPSRK